MVVKVSYPVQIANSSVARCNEDGASLVALVQQLQNSMLDLLPVLSPSHQGLADKGVAVGLVAALLDLGIGDHAGDVRLVVHEAPAIHLVLRKIGDVLRVELLREVAPPPVVGNGLRVNAGHVERYLGRGVRK